MDAFLWWALYILLARCFFFGFPTSIIAGIDKGSGALKLQKEGEKAKERRKEKKTQKKEKKGKKERSREEYGNLEHGEHSHKKRKYGGRKELHEKDGYQKEAGKDAIEQLEKSGLTEEHGLPCCIHEPCESSDSTQNSSKSRKLEATDISRGSHGGTILRFRLPLQKHKDPEQTPTNEEPCFSGRVTNAPTEQEPAESTCSQSRSGRSRSIKSQEMERQFGDLIANWNPAPLLFEDSDIGGDDQGWLFGTSRRQHENPVAKRCGVSSISEDLVHSKAASSLQPRACYLPEFDLYQLPFAIPF